MATDLTDQQRAAIATRDVSIALSAGAGCGKTFVLTERFLSHLEPGGAGGDGGGVEGGDGGGPAELGDLVAFTYTERAAREMRDRIRRKCAERLKLADDRDAPYWLDLLRQLDTARVSTIHSFCGSFLRGHAVEAGLDPQFRVLDEPQSQTRLWELLDDTLRRRLESRDAAAMELAGAYGLAPLRDRVLLMLRHRDHGAFEAFAGMTPEKLWAHWQSLAVEQARRALAAFLASPEFLAARSYFDEHAFDHEKIGPRAAALRQWLDELAESERPGELLAKINEAAKLTGLSKKMFASIGAEYDEYKSCVQPLREAIDGVKSLELDVEACRATARYGLDMLDIARDVAEAYRESKRGDRVLDFNDLLLRTRDLLAADDHAALRRGVARQIRLLLVDESQDTDPVQTELIDALCDGQTDTGKLFVVGDFKQSIYRFLGAEPAIFRERRAAMPQRGRLPLSTNFRSQPAILEFVNRLFGGAFGDEYEPLVAHREQVTPVPAIEFLWANEAGANGGAADAEQENAPARKAAARGDADRLRKLEADWIARRLSGMIRSGEALIPVETERGEDGEEAPLRAVSPGDVAILFRSLSNVEFYEEALRRYDLPYYLVGGRAFYAQQEIFDVANLLRALAISSDDVSLVGVLRSPLFNLSDEALFWLVRHRDGLRAGLFADAYPKDMDAEQQRRARRAADVLAELRASKDRASVAALLNRAIELTGYDAALLGEFLGERKLANLRKLVNLARSFDASGTMSLADFVVQLNEFEADQPKEALAATESEAGDVVRLMTIHQSKGLEFPVVVVADCESRRQGDRDAARFDARWGPLVGLPAREDDEKATTALRMFRTEASAEDDDEAIRLLYVATTRAADYLILSGGVKDVAEAKGFWTKFLAERFDRLTGAYVGPASDASGIGLRIAVTSSVLEADFESKGRERGHNLARIADDAERTARSGGAATTTDAAGRASLPIAADASARRLYSFSRLSGALVREVAIVDKDGDRMLPSVVEWTVGHAEVDDGDELGCEREAALDLGTLVHAVLADLRWDGTDDVAKSARRHMARQLREDEALERQAVGLVERLLSMPAAQEIAAARRRLAEVEFLLAWPPEAARESIGEGIRLLQVDRSSGPILHGFIDMLFQDPVGDWHLVDYKTNRVTGDEVPAAATGYEMQLMLYALAAEKTLGVRPKTLRLCFLVPSAEHRIEWNDQARRQAIARLSSALCQSLEPHSAIEDHSSSD